jgi:uncharacterized membrane protein YphA (DoxX/SURF4 family)
MGISDFEYYIYYGVPGFPFSALLLIPFTVMVLLNIYLPFFGSYLAFIALSDSITITYTQITKWLFYSQQLYINELMVKKFSILGCIILLMLNDPYFKEKVDLSTKALFGLVANEENEKFSKKMSAVLLVARLLISSLFLFVGYGEISRQIVLSQGVHHGNHFHKMNDNDGHNSMWPKIAEFALALPFTVGFQTKNVSRGLALSLLLEATIYWQFWLPNETLPFWYNIHARDHFSVNVGVAGGLLLLQTLGAGKYSVDEYLAKKKE